ncbi:hypothetical protein GYMLUDRAFT_249301 [Collybiopsis luxurians FD-317 M1]|uniref:Uncharacterized protein n=1 Tax=Collybiopsis luxurians FD-317 M1 TaxID=944289 RepID=A0A0D0AVP6_9AGAR|nr:hypothetical protein GYMLUDRAFT_249301 [Collybiopsis luxurians FD-317 M1]
MPSNAHIPPSPPAASAIPLVLPATTDSISTNFFAPTSMAAPMQPCSTQCVASLFLQFSFGTTSGSASDPGDGDDGIDDGNGVLKFRQLK